MASSPCSRREDATRHRSTAGRRALPDGRYGLNGRDGQGDRKGRPYSLWKTSEGAECTRPSASGTSEGHERTRFTIHNAQFTMHNSQCTISNSFRGGGAHPLRCLGKGRCAGNAEHPFGIKHCPMPSWCSALPGHKGGCALAPRFLKVKVAHGVLAMLGKARRDAVRYLLPSQP